ncbi:MAG: hypothetical protein B6D61_11315 [Bacteroidetes bacterium 4484_249]|nr:MAG: hypothetical protein B6D61_11315 [Bacteroidetes bacterium 4484_249]
MENENKSKYYETSIHNEIAVIRIKEKVFDMITDITLSDELSDFIDKTDSNPGIKVLLFFNEPNCFDNRQYDIFIKRITENSKLEDNSGPPCFAEKNVRFREINILNALIKQIANMQVIVIAGIQGEVVTPYIGLSMVADFKYVSENAVLSMAHNKYGLHPSGGLPFFLSNSVHHSKALEIQMKDFITAKEALELGIINKILPQNEYEKHLLFEAGKFTKLKYCTIRDTKRLTNFNRKQLFDYFEYEAGLLNL